MVTVLKRPPATGPFCMDTPASSLLCENIIISSPSVWLAGGGGTATKRRGKERIGPLACGEGCVVMGGKMRLIMSTERTGLLWMTDSQSVSAAPHRLAEIKRPPLLSSLSPSSPPLPNPLISSLCPYNALSLSLSLSPSLCLAHLLASIPIVVLPIPPSPHPPSSAPSLPLKALSFLPALSPLTSRVPTIRPLRGHPFLSSAPLSSRRALHPVAVLQY